MIQISKLLLALTASVCIVGTANARIYGGGDSSGCYSGRTLHDTNMCVAVRASNAARLASMRERGFVCRKGARDHVCSGSGATIVLPHEGRLAE